jgi:hydroxymethylpyrimidine/phosphomethylpyrimidine kinase
MRNVLTIAGSDSSGGAGIQADIKTMSALGVYAMAAITAVTAQNTLGVYKIDEMSGEVVEAQIKAVFDDIRVDAVKVGMVFSAEITEAVRDALLRLGARNIVVDPVMVSKSGSRLLRQDAEEALRGLIAIADVVTPNILEAEILSGGRITDEDGMMEAAKRIAALGAKGVLVKGGHLGGEEAVDLFYHDGRFTRFAEKRIVTPNTHGTGCTLSSAIASALALGDDAEAAVRSAKAYITRAIAASYSVGGGHGPVGHFADLYRRAGMGCKEEE